MTKKKFLDQLRQTTDSSVADYYEEVISDRVEAGEDEETVVASYDIKKIAAESRYKESKAELEKLSKENRKWKVWVVVLALFSAPITIPLGIAFIAVIFSLGIAAISIAAVAITAPVWGIIGGIQVMAGGGGAWAGILLISAGLLILGLMGFFTIWAVKVVKSLVAWLSAKFFSKRRRQEVAA